jgi:hypothetical protein
MPAWKRVTTFTESVNVGARVALTRGWRASYFTESPVTERQTDYGLTPTELEILDRFDALPPSERRGKKAVSSISRNRQDRDAISSLRAAGLLPAGQEVKEFDDESEAFVEECEARRKEIDRDTQQKLAGPLSRAGFWAEEMRFRKAYVDECVREIRQSLAGSLATEARAAHIARCSGAMWARRKRATEEQK